MSDLKGWEVASACSGVNEARQTAGVSHPTISPDLVRNSTARWQLAQGWVAVNASEVLKALILQRIDTYRMVSIIRMPCRCTL